MWYIYTMEYYLAIKNKLLDDNVEENLRVLEFDDYFLSTASEA
jgi:hypothetical protein